MSIKRRLHKGDGGLGSYTNEIKKMRFSFSRVNGADGENGHCLYEWYLYYLLRDDEGKRVYESEDNFYGAFGHFCHELIESVLKKKFSIDEAYVKYQEDFEEKMGIFNTKESTKEKYYYLGLEYFGSLNFDWLEGYEILGIEKEVHFKIGQYDFIGYIDLLIRDKESGEIYVIDHKSAEYPIGKKGNVLKRHLVSYRAYQRQLYLYSKYVIENYGKPPAKIVWNYFRERKWFELPFKMQEYEESIKWAEDTIEKIIEEEEFPPKEDYFYCTNLCGFRSDVCEYRKMGVNT